MTKPNCSNNCVDYKLSMLCQTTVIWLHSGTCTLWIGSRCSNLFALSPVRLLREELQLLQEQGSYVGEVVRAMDKKKVLVKVCIKLFFCWNVTQTFSVVNCSCSWMTLAVYCATCVQVHPEGKFVVDVDKNIDINDVSMETLLFIFHHIVERT